MSVQLVEMEKKALRKEFSQKRKNIAADLRRQFDAAICDRIRALPVFQQAANIAAYISFGAEVDLSPLFHGKRLFLPRFQARSGVYEMVAVEDLKRDLLPGKYGILEPLPSLPAADEGFLASQMLFLVPAVACDRRGCRLGRGGGFYDRMLVSVAKPPVGVAYSCQIGEDLPSGRLDVPVKWIVTENEVINCAGSGCLSGARSEK